MARSIILRFDATCHDCGAPISAGEKARWFGRGRVSCCGAELGKRIEGNPARGARPGNLDPIPATLPAAASPEVRKFIGDTREELDRASAEEPAAMTIARIGQLAETRPNCLLLVRLRDGARFLVPARDAVHVTRCIVESLMDGIRDITVSPKQ